MKLPAYWLLIQVVAVREMPLLDAKELLSNKFDDFRDWYPVAGLIKQGYLANPFIGESGERMTERELASMLFGKTLGEGHHKINNVGAVNLADSALTFGLFATSKADLYLAELRAKRADRDTSALVAIVIGVSSALLTFYAKEYLSPAAISALREPKDFLCSKNRPIAETPNPAVQGTLRDEAAQRP